MAALKIALLVLLLASPEAYAQASRVVVRAVWSGYGQISEQGMVLDPGKVVYTTNLGRPCGTTGEVRLGEFEKPSDEAFESARRLLRQIMLRDSGELGLTGLESPLRPHQLRYYLGERELGGGLALSAARGLFSDTCSLTTGGRHVRGARARLSVDRSGHRTLEITEVTRGRDVRTGRVRTEQACEARGLRLFCEVSRWGWAEFGP